MTTEEIIFYLKSPANGPGGGGHSRFVFVGVSGYLFIRVVLRAPQRQALRST